MGGGSDDGNARSSIDISTAFGVASLPPLGNKQEGGTFFSKMLASSLPRRSPLSIPLMESYTKGESADVSSF